MDKHWAYCSACDRQVEVAVDPTGGMDPLTGDPVEALVCLEVGHTCTGRPVPDHGCHARGDARGAGKPAGGSARLESRGVDHAIRS